jgi:hypothetical protein
MIDTNYQITTKKCYISISQKKNQELNKPLVRTNKYSLRL